MGIPGFGEQCSRDTRLLGLPSHASADRIREELGAEVYDSYESFAVLRNPWDWQVSLYRFMLEYEKHRQHEFAKSLSGFPEYLDWRLAEEVRTQKGFLTDSSGKMLVSTLLKFESLSSDFEVFCRARGLDVKLPHLNSSKRGDWVTYYDSSMFERVREVFEEDVELLGLKDASFDDFK